VRSAINVGGASLRYVCEGSGRPALVIGSAIYYPRTFSAQLRSRLRLSFMDLRHFAEVTASGGPGELSLDTYIDDIHKVHRHLGLHRVVLMGHSHHGNLGLEYAKRYPARVSHVVLVGSPPVDAISTMKAARLYWKEHASPMRKAMLRAKLAALRSEGLTPAQHYVARYVAEGPKYWHDPDFDAAPLWQGVPLNMEAMAVFRSFFAEGYQFQHNLERLTAPVLVVAGQHDYAVPPTLWQELQPALKRFTVKLFKHSGHTPPLEQPDQFDRLLLEWLARTDESAGAITRGSRV
jgi:proline iminopeptidase